ncbi:hypothetical protein MCEMRE20_00464 [Candidatus Nanopelagicaceae bacterium]
MRKLAGLAVIAIAASLISPVQSFAASPKAGAACTKAGSTATAANKKFTCVKSGKKLFWDKGTTVSNAAPAAASSAAPTPKASSAPVDPTASLTIPITLPVAQNGGITFANAVANYTAIPKTAWQRTQDVIAANPDVNVPTTIHIGPNTKASLTAINTALGRINKLFAGFRHVSTYTGIVYNAKDVQWAQSDAFDLFSKAGSKSYAARKDQIKRASEAGCEMNGSTAVNCGGGMSIEFGDVREEGGGAYYGVQADGDYWSDSTKYVGPMSQVNHEAMHTYQAIQFIFTPFGKNQNITSDLMHAATPWWYSEGQANGIGISTFVDNLPDYLRIRNDTVTRSPGSRATIPAFNATSMKAFLNGVQVASPENNNWMLAYSIGFATVEALIAIGGPQSTLAIYTLTAKGEDFETAFKHVYGISWDEGSTILAQVLAAEYGALPMSTR